MWAIRRSRPPAEIRASRASENIYNEINNFYQHNAVRREVVETRNHGCHSNRRHTAALWQERKAAVRTSSSTTPRAMTFTINYDTII